jgi:hypothetical protein
MLADRYATGGEKAAPAEPFETPPPGQTALFNSWEDASSAPAAAAAWCARLLLHVPRLRHVDRLRLSRPSYARTDWGRRKAAPVVLPPQASRAA